MISHNQALNSAETLMEYCRERFSGNERECKECIFHQRRCLLGNLLGMYGVDVAKLTMEIVVANYEELKNAERNYNP